MKTKIFFSLIFSIILTQFIYSTSFAASGIGSTKAPVYDDGVFENRASGQNAGYLLFDFEIGVPGPNEVSVNATETSPTFTGNFWAENIGWVTFGNLGSSKAKLEVTGNSNILKMTGFAWSENAGWIIFNPRNSINTSTIVDSDVFLNKSEGKFYGFAWSQNVGWINMQGAFLDVVPPSIIGNFKAFSASGSKNFTITDDSGFTIPTGAQYTVIIDNWDGGNTTYYTNPFTHDFRAAKDYNLVITDPSGNTSSGVITVVAGTPADTLGTYPINSAMPSVYSSTLSDDKVADNNNFHNININLRDIHGNPVKTVPGIKKVEVAIAFNNDVDKNQIPITSLSGSNLNSGDAIAFPVNNFPGLTYQELSTGTGDNTIGDYSLNITSYAPTFAGYNMTTSDNNISLNKLIYQITPESGNSGVGEGTASILNKFGSIPFKFIPRVLVSKIENIDNWSIRTGYDTNFSEFITHTITTQAITDLKVASIFDINNNILLSYQNPENISGGSLLCKGFFQTTGSFTGNYTSSGSECNRNSSNSSNILIRASDNADSTLSFTWKPKIIYASPSNSEIKFSSEIKYKIDGEDIAYPSLAEIHGGNTGIVGVQNQTIKIMGIVNGDNVFDILSGSTTSRVGTLTKNEIQDLVHKNAEVLTKGGKSGNSKVLYMTGTKNLSTITWQDKDTIIIKGGDLIIDEDMIGKMKGVIVLRDGNTGGNIWITANVQNISAVLFADNSIFSGDGSNYYSDSKSATNQLYIEGSIISNNTIGGASMTPLKCSYNASSCNEITSKHYDLNYFRFYIADPDGVGPINGIGSPAQGVPAGGENFPMIIKYNPALISNPPPGFKN